MPGCKFCGHRWPYSAGPKYASAHVRHCREIFENKMYLYNCLPWFIRIFTKKPKRKYE